MLQARQSLVPFGAVGGDAAQTIHRRDTMETLERGLADVRRRVAEPAVRTVDSDESVARGRSSLISFAGGPRGRTPLIA